MKMTASLDFQIVIHETIHLGSGEERIGRVPRFVSQTREVHDGHVVVTVAKP